jgi:tetratricopeptide (TPR) repeat protein
MALRIVGEMEGRFSPDDTYILTNRSLLGNIEEKMGNLEAAEEQYRLALAGRLAKEPQAPSTVLSLARLGSLLLKKGQFAEGSTLLEQAWKARGGGVNSSEDRLGLEILDKLAIAWNRIGRRPEAVKLMRQYLPFFATGAHTLLYNLACYECLEGNLDEAKRLIADHLVLQPGMKATALADSDFTAIHSFIEAL